MGEGQEAYDEVVRAGNMSIYLDKMSDKEDRDAFARAKEVSFNRNNVSVDDILEAKSFNRKQAEGQARQENTEFTERSEDSERTTEETEEETLAVLYFSQNHAEDDGREPNAEDVLDAYQTLDTAKRHRASSEDIKHWGAYEDFLGAIAEKQRKREMISPELKAAIIGAAEQRFEKYFSTAVSTGTVDKSGKELRNIYDFTVALQAERSGTHEHNRINDGYRGFLDALFEDVVTDEVVGKIVGNDPRLEAAVREWAYKYYGKELKAFIQKKLGADNYSI